MNKLKKTIAKNTFFTTRLWWPTRVILTNVAGDFELRTMGFGAKVVCQIKQSMKAPMPTVEYIDYDQYKAVWLENAAEHCSVHKGMSHEESKLTADQMLRKYTLDTYILDAINDHFGVENDFDTQSDSTSVTQKPTLITDMVEPESRMESSSTSSDSNTSD